MASNRLIGGTQRRRCSSEPSTSIEAVASPQCTPKKLAIDGSTRPSSSLMSPANSGSFGGQLKPSGMSSWWMPANFGTTSIGKWPSSQAASAIGAISSSRKRRRPSHRSRWSGVRVSNRAYRSLCMAAP